jgi:hypothetical protein
MAGNSSGNSSGASSLMKSVREDVVMSTYSVAMIAGTVLMLGNMSRNLHLGNPLSIPHSVLYLAFLATYVLRHRIGARWLAPILLVALYLAGTFGYFIYGFIGNSAPLYMTLCIVAASFYGPRGGLIAAIASGAMMVVAAALAMSGHLVFGFDMKAFISSPLPACRKWPKPTDALKPRLLRGPRWRRSCAASPRYWRTFSPACRRASACSMPS